MRKIKELKNKLLLTALYMGILLIFWAFDMPCIFKHFLGVECIGCGMSRAVWSVLRLDFKSAFSYHPMFWSVPVLYLYLLYDGNLIGKKCLDKAVLILIALGFVLNWIIKIV